MAKYLLVLKASVRCGSITGETKKKIEIECEPEKLDAVVELERAFYALIVESSRQIQNSKPGASGKLESFVSVESVAPLVVY